MKRVLKSNEPATLIEFRAAEPTATWDDMRRDAFHNGRQAAKDCLEQSIADQNGLCAYCECKIDPQKPHRCRVEHFHPKSDISTAYNWNLDWQNMIAACNGGETDEAPDTPLPDNLTCDAYKNHLVNTGRLTCDVEKGMINPLDLPAFPNVFTLNKGTGHFRPDLSACRQAGVNACKLQHTINVLNLNCNRLARSRRAVFLAIEKRKQALKGRQYSFQQALDIMVKQYLDNQQPEYFSTYRCCLGQAAEDHLQNMNYNG